MDAGKHVYQEKAMAFTVEQAKAMRAAYQRAGKRVVQIGHQSCSSGQVADAANYLASGAVGQVTAIRAHMYRNTPHGKPQWTRPVYPDMTPENIDWNAFLGAAPARDFDADRYVNWRSFRDYSGGNVHENMSQQLAFWYKVMDLDIPCAVTMTGGIYRWKDGREVPDTMSVVDGTRRRQLLFSWDSGFGNNHPASPKTCWAPTAPSCAGQQIRYLPQKVNRPGWRRNAGPDAHRPRAPICRTSSTASAPARRRTARSRSAIRVSVACRMAIESLPAGPHRHWDPAKEEIV